MVLELDSMAVPRWGGGDLPPRTLVAEALLCPFPLTLNRHVRAAHDHCVRWLDDLHGDPRLVQRAAGARMAWMVAGFYPNASLDPLCLAADYLCWAFALDDYGDETPAGQRPAQLAQAFDSFDSVFRGVTPPNATDPAVRGLHDIVQRLGRFASAQQMTDFHEANRAYFGGMLWEANNRASGWVPDESTFMTLRPAAGAVPPFFALIEPIEGIVLAPSVKQHPDVQALGRLAGGIVCWVNDVLSYEKEKRLGDVHNLAIVYEEHRGLASGNAIARAVAQNNLEVLEFLERQASLPSFGATQDEQLRRYLNVLGSMMRVTRDWTLGSARYADFDDLPQLAG
jgi:5-epi-alpha-selinene synthase